MEREWEDETIARRGDGKKVNEWNYCGNGVSLADCLVKEKR